MEMENVMFKNIKMNMVSMCVFFKHDTILIAPNSHYCDLKSSHLHFCSVNIFFDTALHI